MTDVYLLEKRKATEPDTVWELHAWTESLQVAQKWAQSSGRDERREFRDLYFAKKINSVDQEF